MQTKIKASDFSIHGLIRVIEDRLRIWAWINYLDGSRMGAVTCEKTIEQYPDLEPEYLVVLQSAFVDDEHFELVFTTTHPFQKFPFMPDELCKRRGRDTGRILEDVLTDLIGPYDFHVRAGDYGETWTVYYADPALSPPIMPNALMTTAGK